MIGDRQEITRSDLRVRLRPGIVESAVVPILTPRTRPCSSAKRGATTRWIGKATWTLTDACWVKYGGGFLPPTTMTCQARSVLPGTYG